MRSLLLSVALVGVLGCGGGGSAATGGSTGSGAPAGCEPKAGATTSQKTAMNFFVDMNCKAPEPGYVYRYTYVIWNDGDAPAENVELTLPLVQKEPTWDRLTGITYVPGSMGINRTYNPDTSEESYYFVPFEGLSDADDCDEGTFDAAKNTVTYRRAQMPAASSGQNNYAVFVFDVKVDPGLACKTPTLLQALTTIKADNAPAYQNDIAGEVVCTSPKLRATLAVDDAHPAPGQTVTFTVNYAYDSAPIDKPGRFDLVRVRFSHSFPKDKLTFVGSSDGATDEGGVAYVQLDALAAGGSGSWSWQAKVAPNVAAGATIATKVGVVSQNTVDKQDEGDALSLVVGP